MLLGIDISNHDVAVILAQADGGAVVALRGELPGEGGAPAVWNTAMATAREAMHRGHVEPAQITCVALAIDAPIDASGVVTKGPRTIGWEGIDLPRELGRHLGVSQARAGTRVLCEALGEQQFGALRPDMQSPHYAWLFVHIGSRLGAATSASTTNNNSATSVGAPQALSGASAPGRPARQARTIDIGAVCLERDGVLCASGRRGCLEGYCGGESFAARAASYGLTLKTAREIWEMAGSNFAARSLCDDYIRRLSQGLGIAVTLLDTTHIVLGGAMANGLSEQLLVPLRQGIKEFCPPSHTDGLEIAGAQLGSDAAVMGAVVLAMDTVPDIAATG